MPILFFLMLEVINIKQIFNAEGSADVNIQKVSLLLRVVNCFMIIVHMY